MGHFIWDISYGTFGSGAFSHGTFGDLIPMDLLKSLLAAKCIPRGGCG